MPTNLNVGDYIEVSFEGKLDLQQTISTFHYRVQAVDGSFPMFTELDDFISKLRLPGKLFQMYQNVCSDALVNLNVYVQVVYPIRYRYTNGGELDQTGAVDELAMPSNVQASITRAAERAGRRYVSHLAVPAVPITAVENSQLTAGYLGDLHVLATVMTESIVLASGAELGPVILHPQYDPVFEKIQFAFPQPTSRVQRRRTVGLGS